MSPVSAGRCDVEAPQPVTGKTSAALRSYSVLVIVSEITFSSSTVVGPPGRDPRAADAEAAAKGQTSKLSTPAAMGSLWDRCASAGACKSHFLVPYTRTVTCLLLQPVLYYDV